MIHAQIDLDSHLEKERIGVMKRFRIFMKEGRDRIVCADRMDAGQNALVFTVGAEPDSETVAVFALHAIIGADACEESAPQQD